MNHPKSEFVQLAGKNRAFKSRSSTSAEQYYCPFERETLANVFACLKFNEYLHDKKIIIESDHEPLKSILNISHQAESNEL